MKCQFYSTVAILVTAMIGGKAFGQDALEFTAVEQVSFGADSSVLVDKNCDDCGKGCDNGCGKGGCGVFDCCDRGSITFDVELTFMRYAQEGGVTDTVGSPGQFDLELAPRFELAYELASGLGARARYWFYDYSTESVIGDVISVDTYYFDFEMFQRLDVTCNTEIEISGGIRYLDFEQSITDFVGQGAIISGTDAIGGIIGIQSRTQTRLGALYARARWGILQGDAGIINVFPMGNIAPFSATDNTIQQLELAFGYEIARCTDWGVFTARIGAEWQQWANVAVADTSFGGIGRGDVLEDVGFAGIVFGLGFER